MAEYSKSFNCGTKTENQPGLQKPLDVRRGKQEWLKRNEAKISEEKRREVMAQIQELNSQLRSIPYSGPHGYGIQTGCLCPLR